MFNPIIIALLKSAMFDEGSFFGNNRILQIICMILLFADTLTAVVSFVSLILMWSKKDKLQPKLKLLITVIFAVIFVNYISFCLGYPQFCTENIRCCIPLIFCGAFASGRFIMRAKPNDTKTVFRYFAKISAVSMISMSCLSVFVYMAMMFYSVQ